ncbi:MAG: hypothetical protein KAR20_08070 [Candidatus Heimdallarchaeota archaeon]|nr:hypothetical protein [Candidatus Heimdallarchaeota archaeon]
MQQKVDKKILQISVFVPLSACSCVFEKFLNRAFDILIPFKEHMDFEVKDITGPERSKYKTNIGKETVMVEELGIEDGNVVNRLFFTNLTELKVYMNEKFKN